MQAGRDAVLIETLWNVKSGSFCPVLIVPTVLIETLWNVKKVGALIIFRNGSRINRNIVECKEITIHLHSEHGPVSYTHLLQGSI